MNEEILIKGIPLIKTQAEEYIDFLQKGTLYCNKLSYYRNLENEHGDSIIGDSFEAMLPLTNATVYFPEEETCFQIQDKLIPTTWSDDYIFCMTGLKPNLIVEENMPILSSVMDSFGQKSLLILDSQEFIRRIKIAAQMNGYSVECDFVRYYDDEYNNLDMLSSLVYKTSNIAFWKRKKYSSQSEFRFLFHGNFDKDHLELPIGDISDISKTIDCDKLVKTFIHKF
jgi:hypothetical protein